MHCWWQVPPKDFEKLYCFCLPLPTRFTVFLPIHPFVLRLLLVMRKRDPSKVSTDNGGPIVRIPQPPQRQQRGLQSKKLPSLSSPRGSKVSRLLLCASMGLLRFPPAPRRSSFLCRRMFGVFGEGSEFRVSLY